MSLLISNIIRSGRFSTYPSIQTAKADVEGGNVNDIPSLRQLLTEVALDFEMLEFDKTYLVSATAEELSQLAFKDVEITDGWKARLREEYALEDIIVAINIEPAKVQRNDNPDFQKVKVERKQYKASISAKTRYNVVIVLSATGMTALPIHSYHNHGIAGKNSQEPREHVPVRDLRDADIKSKEHNNLTPYTTLVAELIGDKGRLRPTSHVRFAHPKSLDYNFSAVQVGNLVTESFQMFKSLFTDHFGARDGEGLRVCCFGQMVQLLRNEICEK
jgi:hypothetical protein